MVKKIYLVLKINIDYKNYMSIYLVYLYSIGLTKEQQIEIDE